MSKKYLLVLPTFDLGGAERQALNLAEYLCQSGRDVTIIAKTKSGRVNQICEEKNIPYYIFVLKKGLSYYVLGILKILHLIDQNISPYMESISSGLAAFIKKNEFDVCISYCTPANVWLGNAALLYPKPVYIWYQRDAGLYDNTDFYECKSCKGFDFFLSNSCTGQKWLQENLKVDVQVIRNGVHLETARHSARQWREKLGIDDQDILCIMVANLNSNKDHLSILKIWEEIRGRRLDFKFGIHLVFAGREDDTAGNIKEYVRKSALSDKVHCVGPVTDVAGLLSASDICVFGAISEGSPNGIIEATLKGLPVVATDLPEIREVVSNENNRFLFKRGDISYAADCIIELAENRELRHSIGIRNQKKNIEEYSFQKNFSEIINLAEGKKKTEKNRK